MGKRLDRLCVAGTVLLISFIGFSSQVFVVLPAVRYRYSDPELLRILLPFNLLLALVFYNYALVVRTDPGRVPKGWVSRRESPFETSGLSRTSRIAVGNLVYRQSLTRICSSTASGSQIARDRSHRGEETDGRTEVLSDLSRSVRGSCCAKASSFRIRRKALWH